MVKTVWHMALEPIETRYTGQWLTTIDDELKARNVNVRTILGKGNDASTATPGAFLNFTATNVWKNDQTNQLAEAIQSGELKDGDHVFFPDAWHTGVLQVKYMAELMDRDITISGYWHAGSYDPQDFLGRKIKDKRWSYNTERALFYALDYNFFATKFHLNMMTENLGIQVDSSVVLTGQPHNAIIEAAKKFSHKKRNLILFPHRIAPEKQLDIFLDLKASLPEYEFVVCQEEKLSKQEYHQLLSDSKLVFSANLQETLGISAMEAVMFDSYPILPDRLSYSEMYKYIDLYDSKATMSFESYLQHKPYMLNFIQSHMENTWVDTLVLALERNLLIEEYLTATPMFDTIVKS